MIPATSVLLHDVVQVNDKLPEATGSLWIVEAVKDWGVEVAMRVPFRGVTCLRLKYGEFEIIGRAVYVEQLPEEDI